MPNPAVLRHINWETRARTLLVVVTSLVITSCADAPSAGDLDAMIPGDAPRDAASIDAEREPADAARADAGPAGDAGRDASAADGGLVPRGGRCTRTEECMGSPATCEDPYCNDAGYCTGSLDVECFACRDSDGDGYLGGTCGPDCNNSDPSVHPGAVERCDNARDDDCDGLFDGEEVVCGAPANLRCEDALAIASGVSVEPHIPLPMAGPAFTGCGRSVFYTLSVAEESDIEVRIVLPPDTPAITTSSMGAIITHGVRFRAALRADCAAKTDYLASAFGSATACAYYDALFSPSTDRVFLARRVPAGTYVLEVSEGLELGHPNPDRLSFVHPTITATARAAQLPECNTAPIAVGTSTHFAAPTRDATTCDGAAGTSDRMHRFTLASRARIRARVTNDSPSTVQLGILTACDANTAAADCDSIAPATCTGPIATERVLEAGTYFVLVETATGYQLELLADPVDDACSAAPLLSATALSGDLRGASNDFEWSPEVYPGTCSRGNGPDDVYRVDVAVRSSLHVLTSSAMFTTTRLTRGCGEETLGSDYGTASTFSSALDPGTYFVIVDALDTARADTYTISGTLTPL